MNSTMEYFLYEQIKSWKKNNDLQKEFLELAQFEIIEQIIQTQHPDVDILISSTVNNQSKMIQWSGVNQSFVAFESDKWIFILGCTLDVEQIAFMIVCDDELVTDLDKIRIFLKVGGGLTSLFLDRPSFRPKIKMSIRLSKVR